MIILFLASCSSGKDEAEIYFETGVKYMGQSELKKAIGEFKKEVELNPFSLRLMDLSISWILKEC